MGRIVLSLLVPGWAQARAGKPRMAFAVAGAAVLLLAAAAVTPWLHSFAGAVTFLAVALAGGGAATWDTRRHRAAGTVPVSHRFAAVLAAPFWVLLAAIVLWPGAVAGLRAYRIPAEHTSNAPTLLPHDRLLAETRLRRPPARGDWVLFRAPGIPEATWIRRVVALEGDVVETAPDGVRVNGRLVAEGPAGDADSLRVGRNRCFVLGEDLQHSRDSRHFGPIGIDTIIGRPLYVFWADAWERIGRSLN